MTAIFGTIALVYLAASAVFAVPAIAAGVANAGRTGFTPTMLVR